MRAKDPHYGTDDIDFESLVLNFGRIVQSHTKKTFKQENRRSGYISVMLTLIKTLQPPSVRISYENVFQRTVVYGLPKSERTLIATTTLEVLEDFRQQLSELIYSEEAYATARHFGGISFDLEDDN